MCSSPFQDILIIHPINYHSILTPEGTQVGAQFH